MLHVAIHENDLTSLALLANKQLSDGAYDWLKVLKYYMEIKNVLQATSEDYILGRTEQTGSEEDNTQSKTGLQQIGKRLSDVQLKMTFSSQTLKILILVERSTGNITSVITLEIISFFELRRRRINQK